MKEVKKIAKFQITSTLFTVYLDNSLILVAANDNQPANLAVWNKEVQIGALKSLGEAQN